MPLIAFIMLAVVCLAIFGFACACITDQPAQALERAISVGGDLPAVIEVWSPLVVALMGAWFSIAARERATSRASPAVLQRFLF
jgi:hypothetical protein